MIERLLLLGATGDRPGPLLVPALAELLAADALPDGFEVVGAARQELSDDQFRRAAAERLERHAADVPAEARAALLRRLRYRQVDLASEDLAGTVRGLVSGISEADAAQAE